MMRRSYTLTTLHPSSSLSLFFLLMFKVSKLSFISLTNKVLALALFFYVTCVIKNAFNLEEVVVRTH